MQNKLNSLESIWILEDDCGCQFVYEEILNIRYKVSFFKKLSEIETAFEGKEIPKLIIADIRLADGHFLDYLQSEKGAMLKHFPFIVVSSLDDLDAIRFCFQQGAVDYLVKPFKKNELIVKIENFLSTNNLQTNDVKTLDPLSVQFKGRTLSNLTAKEYSIVSMFVGAQDNTLSKKDILEKVWKGMRVHEKTVDVHLHNIRKKLNPSGLKIISLVGGAWRLEC